MKRVNVILSTLMIVTILVGSFGMISKTLMKHDGGTTTIGMITTLDDPNPVGR